MRGFQRLAAGPSRLERQLGALGYLPADSLPQGAVSEEKAALERLPRRQLTLRPLPKMSPASVAAIAGILALAACLTLFVRIGSPQLGSESSDLMAKGLAAVTLYWERAGVVHVLKSGERLDVGDRIRVEVAVARNAVAYMFIFNNKGKLFNNLDEVSADALEIPGGGSKPFAASFRLVGESEGERLAVAVCDAHELESTRFALGSLGTEKTSAAQLKKVLGRACEIYETPLR